MAYMRTTGGLGEYDRVPPWSWMYYPPPYGFADPQKLTPPPGFHAPPETMGMGGCGCGGSCGGCGMGDAGGPLPVGTVLLVGGGLAAAWMVYQEMQKQAKRARTERAMKRVRGH